jgi:aryl-alcohol dehydrogenase-like predicted oxidoreductase
LLLQFEFSLTNRKALKSGLIDACKELSVTPVAHTPLGGGLASGKYTALDPTGGKIGKAKYDFQTLEPLTPIHEAQERVSGMVRSRLRQAFKEQKDLRLKDYRAKPMQGDFNQSITTAQVALHYVIAKGAVPVPGINNLKEANELLGCVGWALTEEEVSILDDACDESERSKPTTKKTIPLFGRRKSNRVDMGF